MANPKQINANYRKTERLLEENPTPIDVGVSKAVANYIGDLNIGESTDAESSTGSLWARIKYILSNMVDKVTNQTIGGVKTFSSSPVIPTTPATTTSAVNQAYVESTVDGVNNLVHKSGNESIAGNKNFTQSITGRFKNTVVVPASDITNYYEICSYSYITTGSRVCRLELTGNYGTAFIHFNVYLRQQAVYIGAFYSSYNISYSDIKMTSKTIEGRTYVRLFMKTPTSCRISARLLGAENYGNEIVDISLIQFGYGDQTPYAELNPDDFDEIHNAEGFTGVLS